MNSDFSSSVLKFVDRIEALRVSLPFSATVMTAVTGAAQNDLVDYFKENADDVTEDGDVLEGKMDPDKLAQFNRRAQRLKRLSISDGIVPRSFVISLVCEYDAFVGEIIRLILRTRPEILTASGKVATFSDILEWKSIDDAIQAMIDTEVESILRESHTKQIEYLEKRLSMNLRTDRSLFAEFVEITERRNLFTHTDGRVSRQYLSACVSAGYEFEDQPALGGTLTVTPPYFYTATDTILEVGIKLSHTIWNKLLPEQGTEIASCLNLVAYDLIVERRYVQALNILKFALTIPKAKFQQAQLWVMEVNKLQCMKWMGYDEEFKKGIESKDWSALGDEFQLAKAVLEDNFVAAAQTMHRIKNASTQFDPVAYQEWPLFKEFRKSHEFQVTYQELYGDKITTVSKPTTSPRSLIALLATVRFDEIGHAQPEQRDNGHSPVPPDEAPEA